MRIVCNKCGYQFESKGEKSCPYCGDNRGLSPIKNADELIKEVE